MQGRQNTRAVSTSWAPTGLVARSSVGPKIATTGRPARPRDASRRNRWRRSAVTRSTAAISAPRLVRPIRSTTRATCRARAHGARILSHGRVAIVRGAEDHGHDAVSRPRRAITSAMRCGGHCFARAVRRARREPRRAEHPGARHAMRAAPSRARHLDGEVRRAVACPLARDAQPRHESGSNRSGAGRQTERAGCVA